MMFIGGACIAPLAKAEPERASAPLFRTTTYLKDSTLEAEIDSILSETEEKIQGGRLGGISSGSGFLKPGQIWWNADAKKPLGLGQPRKVSLDELYVRAIEHSTQIKVFNDIPLIRETSIEEAKGVFDTHGFLEAAYDYTNNPVGTLLDTGYTTGRFSQTEFRNRAGLRKRVATGADISLSQEVNFLENNSQFLIPNPQANARLRLAIVQPLLRGAGIAYNRALIDIAMLDTEAAFEEQLRQAESHILEICRSYWTLYFSRVSYVRKQRYAEQARSIAAELKAREEVDAIHGQIARAESAVAFRESDIARAQMEIANAQDRIRALVGDIELDVIGGGELIPADTIISKKYPVSYRQAARRAIAQRPEVQQAILQIRAAAVRVKMARNEVLPQLNLFLQGYIAGIDEGRNWGGAWAHQFDQGRPGASIGFSLELPFENRTAKARLQRHRIELRQAFNQLKSTIDTVLLEVQASVREVETAWKDCTSKLRAVDAASADLAQYSSRREIDTEGGTPGAGGRTQSTYLDEWLNSQSRLDVAEQEFSRVATIYQVALVNLERAQGNLLKFENITVERTEEKNLPLLKLRKEGRPAEAPLYRK